MIFVILADFSHFGINAQIFSITNFGFDSNVSSFFVWCSDCLYAL
jgi:hypothetical protein